MFPFSEKIWKKKQSGSLQVKNVSIRLQAKKSQLIQSDQTTYLFWKTGKLYYKDTPLHEVFAELEPLFGQKIVVSDSLILTNRWNSTHVGQDLAWHFG